MKIITRNEAKIINTPHGSEIRSLIDRTTSEIERCSLAEEILPPGAAVGKHFHLETEEIYYVISGSGMMTVGEEKSEVGEGDAIYIPRGSHHTLTNIGATPMTILLVCGPAHSFDDHHTLSD